MGWHSVPNDQNTNRHRRPFHPSCLQHSWVRSRCRHLDSRCYRYNVGMCGCYTFQLSNAILLICPSILVSPTMSSGASNCATWRCMVLMMLATSCSVALGARSSQWHFSCVRNPLSSICSRQCAIVLTSVFTDWVFVSGSAILSISIGLNAVSGHAICTAVFVAVAAVATFVLSSIPTLSKISWLAAAGAISILVSSEDRPP
jgi:hypothetical protein